MTRKLRVFLCHASQDKPAVRKLYKRLAAEPWIEPWLDEENLLPGQDFDLEIYKATRDADAIIICLSKVSVAKEGYVNKEIRRALDAADEKPEGAIYIIPLRLDDCNPSFERLKKLHYADYFTPNAHERLLKSLHLRADSLKIEISELKGEPTAKAMPAVSDDNVDLDLYRFIQIPLTEQVPYSFYIGKYPITNAQYDRFLNAPDFSNPIYWLEFPKFDENHQKIGDWGKEGLNWLQTQLMSWLPNQFIGARYKVIQPRFWTDEDFGKSNPDNPVVGISWYEACAYCEWLFQNWNTLSESKVNLSLKPQTIRLPLDIEWLKAAGGGNLAWRYPWDEIEKATTSLKEILRRANVKESGIGHTTPVTAYPLGKSTFGVMDMAGNVWEWQANCSKNESGHEDLIMLCGGSWDDPADHSKISVRLFTVPYNEKSINTYGFRVTVLTGK